MEEGSGQKGRWRSGCLPLQNLLSSLARAQQHGSAVRPRQQRPPGPGAVVGIALVRALQEDLAAVGIKLDNMVGAAVLPAGCGEIRALLAGYAGQPTCMVPHVPVTPHKAQARHPPEQCLRHPLRVPRGYVGPALLAAGHGRRLPHNLQAGLWGGADQHARQCSVITAAAEPPEGSQRPEQRDSPLSPCCR